MAPVDLHRLARFLSHFLVNAPSSRSNLAQIPPYQDDAPLISVGPFDNLFVHADRGKIRRFGNQGIDLFLVGVQDAATLGADSFDWAVVACRVLGRQSARLQPSFVAMARCERPSTSCKRRTSAQNETFIVNWYLMRLAAHGDYCGRPCKRLGGSERTCVNGGW